MGAAAAVAAGVLTMYTNGFASRAALKQMKQVKGNHCTRRLAQGRMEVTVGKHTPQCVYRAPVTGSKISVTAAVALTKVTPTAKRGRAFQAVWLHGGNGGKYELAVRSQQQKWFLRRYHPPDNTVDRKFSGRIKTGVHKINGVGKRNRLKLTIFTAGKIVARVNGKVVKRFTDPSPADIGGEDVLPCGRLGRQRRRRRQGRRRRVRQRRRPDPGPARPDPGRPPPAAPHLAAHLSFRSCPRPRLSGRAAPGRDPASAATGW